MTAAEQKQVLLQYSERFGEASSEDSTLSFLSAEKDGQAVRQSGTVEDLRAQLERDLSAHIDARDSEITVMLRTLNKEQAARQEKEFALKEMSRCEYGIGWKVESVPRNAGRVAEAEGQPVPQGMCCLVLDEETGSIGVDATVEPAAAVNLEYLSLALQVRSCEGREPFFSLDPVDPQNPSMQEKRFEPDWLAGTSVGEVMFQADYHLKELSMGQYDQPVVGMKSCLDLSENEMRDKEWNAREWFVVKDADVLMSEDKVLVPYVNMGVEAREQIATETGMVDAPLTKPDHPLVKYAEVFSRNFDLIAERKSVVYHLRELAKASVLAKFLFESEVELDDSWFDLADPASVAVSLEVPQLWNERVHSQIHVQDGKVVEAEKGLTPKMNGVYGGVQFGLDRFTVGARPATLSATVVGARGVAPRVSAALSMATSVTGGLRAPTMMRAASAMRAGVPSARAAVSMRAGGVARGVAFGLDRFTVGARPATLSATVVGARGVAPRVSAALSMATSVTGGLRAPTMMRAASAMRAGVPSARAAVSMRAGGVARGVDLNLDEFNLSEAGAFAGDLQSEEANAPMGTAFWSSLDGEAVFKEEDIKLFKSIYNEKLSDRREEGDVFVPPETSLSYIQKLRSLVKEESAVQEDRVQHFFSSEFSQENAGTLFPGSWRPAFEVMQQRSSKKAFAQPRPEYLSQAAALESAWKSSEPVFDRSTEEGLRFRIYRVGGLEIRTTQEITGEEALGAVFSA